MTDMTRRPLGGIAVLFITTALIAGCGRASSGAGGTQVVAKVNDKEITTSQLNQVLQASGTKERTPEVVRQAIDSLVNEELLVQQALDRKLDRDPAVMQATEKARRQVLAAAFAERELIPKGEISETEKMRYYEGNPALFEQRQIYHLAVFSLPQKDMTDPFSDELNRTGSAEQVRALLKKSEIPFEEERVERSAEQLPMGALPKFSAAKVGDVLTAPQPDGKIMLMAVTQIEPSPLSLEKARPAITLYLDKNRARLAVEEHLRHAKALASIAYVGTAAEASPPPTAAEPQTTKAGDAPGEYMKKGLSGLK